MPTYDYRCKSCGFRFDEFQSITAEPLKKCPKCGGKVERIIAGGNGLIFKGSGFYVTDYKKRGKSRSETKSEKSDEKSGASTEKTTETTK
jgi:putative FmdB family regulatory protein